MAFWDRWRRNGNGTALKEAAQPEKVRELAQDVATLEFKHENLQETIAQLELALEDSEWRRLQYGVGEDQFSREGLRKITENARLYAIKNPIINRAVNLESVYVWAQGVSVTCSNDVATKLLAAFMSDQRNKLEIGHQGRMHNETALQTDGNVFFVMHINKSSGRVKITSVPFSDIEDVVSAPEDRSEPWFYKRVFRSDVLDPATGNVEMKQKTVWHPDWRYNAPGEVGRLRAIAGHEVRWDEPMAHLKVGAFQDWKFGLSEMYPALDWAKAYKLFLEDVATIMRTLSRFAAKLITGGGARAVQASKNKLQSSVTATSATEGNPAPVPGSVFIATNDADYQPLPLRGASIAPEDGRRFLLMACAATGWPETFFGDTEVGTLATARSLDRPTELRVRNRQLFWADFMRDLAVFVLKWAVRAPSGKLRTEAKIVIDEDGVETLWLKGADGKLAEVDITIDFPPIVEHSVTESVQAIVQAATLGGNMPAGTISPMQLSRMLLVALNQENVDKMLKELFPNGDAEGKANAQADNIANAAKQLRGLLDGLNLDEEEESEDEAPDAQKKMAESLIEANWNPTQPRVPAGQPLRVDSQPVTNHDSEDDPETHGARD